MKNFQRNPLASPRHTNQKDLLDQRITREYPNYQNDETQLEKLTDQLEAYGKLDTANLLVEQQNQPKDLLLRSKLLRQLANKKKITETRKSESASTPHLKVKTDPISVSMPHQPTPVSNNSENGNSLYLYSLTSLYLQGTQFHNLKTLSQLLP